MAPNAVRSLRVSREIVRYAVVGVSNTAISMAVYAGLLALGVGYVAAVVVAYVAGVANGYTLNRRWTFVAGSFSIGSLSRYTTVQVTGLLLSVGLTSLFVEHFGVSKLLALMLSWPPVIAVTFTATRLWAFGSRPRV
ncbi:MAG TPA: GtrA family protein [Thermoleophilaceae bacterium]|nr:GtrA family protein [Thermoleophilaceae bacterium]